MFFGVFFFGLAALIMIPYTLDYASRGDTLQVFYGIVGGLVGVSFCAILVPNLRVRRKELPRGITAGYDTGDGPGLRIVFALTRKLIVILWLVVGVAFLVLRGLLFATHLSKTDDSGRSAINVGGLIIVICALALAVVMISYLALGKNRRGSVIMTPGGITLALGSAVRTIAWDEIGAVYAVLISNSRAVRINPAPDSRIRVKIGRNLIDYLQRGYYEQNMDLHAGVLGIDPALLLYLVRFYRQHPDARQELATKAVVNRMRSGELLVER
ncbi:hypothetical protein AWN90_11055 [Nocardia terpenica]|uniref:Uncharacterized protein n=2 Tax=Nocardia terpenica TaxID=455432 RepID=A0A164HD78_9NOCA|nr:hypothetical protein AWN90_11055 [Nocardia terpenica]